MLFWGRREDYLSVNHSFCPSCCFWPGSRLSSLLSLHCFFFFFNLDFYFFQALLTFYLVCLQLIICTFFNLYNFSASLFSLYIFSFTPTHFFFPPYSFTFLPLFYLHTFFPHSLYISQPWTQQGAPGLESLDLSNLLLSQAENIDDRVLTVTCVVVFLCVSVCSSWAPSIIHAACQRAEE